MSASSLTSILIWLPVAGAILIWLLPLSRYATGALAMLFSLAEVGFWIEQAARFDFSRSGLQMEERARWFGDLEERHTRSSSTFREPTATDVDHLTLVRVGATGLARLSHATLFRSGLGVRAMILDDGSVALGPEFEAGFQTFPLRPLAFDGTFRVAGLSGAGAAWFGTALLEGSAGAGVLLGRVELRAGYRALVIGNATTLAGPTLGARIWF